MPTSDPIVGTITRYDVGTMTGQDSIPATVSQVSRYDLQTMTRQHSNPAAMTEQDPIEIPEKVHGYKKIPRRMQ